ncbi:DUF4377 domain-containing protein [Lutimonas sp.]|uniref:DUF4377 domain-containing protein n=1 Tax=Lutimonas sp. TaxID=1872403 RepID=UPI003D9B9CDF
MPVLTTFMIVSIMSCESNPKVQTLWVNSAKVDCVGVGPMQCFQIKNEEDEPWTNLYQEISGFEFEPGYIYKLKVAIDTLDKATLPADKSSLVYRLVDVLSKQADPVLSLNDIWVVTKIEGAEAKSINSRENPVLEINTRSMNILGSDGCNNYRGKIEALSENKISFGPIMSTKKACRDMDLPNKYTTALSKVKSFKKEHLELILYDENNQELLSFKKVD